MALPALRDPLVQERVPHAVQERVPHAHAARLMRRRAGGAEGPGRRGRRGCCGAVGDGLEAEGPKLT